MTSIKDWAILLIKAIEEQDVATFKRCRFAIVSALADNDYSINSTENLFDMSSVSDNLLVGEALTILLSDMSKSGLIYRRVVTSAMYCLLKTIINDKSCLNKETKVASIFLLILFEENQDFIGAEYIMEGVKNNADVAAHQFIGMTLVFYWMYKLSSFPIELDSTTNSRLQKSLNNLLLQMPDESTRKRVVDFEYDNFDAMSKSLPLDFELKYPGFPFWEPDIIKSKIEAMFGNSSIYFPTKDSLSHNNSANKTYQGQNTPAFPHKNTLKSANTSSNGVGCFSVIVLVIVISIFSII